MIKPLVFVFLCGVISMSEVRASEQAQIRTLRERPITEAIKERRMDRFYKRAEQDHYRGPGALPTNLPDNCGPGWAHCRPKSILNHDR